MSPARNPAVSLIKLFLAGITSGFKDFLESSDPDPGKNHPKAEIFPERKSLTNNINILG
jgi:hypothetical protein